MDRRALFVDFEVHKADIFAVDEEEEKSEAAEQRRVAEFATRDREEEKS